MCPEAFLRHCRVLGSSEWPSRSLDITASCEHPRGDRRLRLKDSSSSSCRGKVLGLSQKPPGELGTPSTLQGRKEKHAFRLCPFPISVAQLCLTLCDPMDRSTPGLPVPHHLLEFTQTHVHGVGDAIQPSHPLSSPSPPAFNLPSIRVFSNESALSIRWSKDWSFSFSLSPSNEHQD